MAPIRMERIESGVRTIIAFIEALNCHDLPAMLQLLSDDCVLEAPFPAPDGAIYKGKVAVAQYWQQHYSQTPDAHLKIEETIGFGQRCIARWRNEWTDASGNSSHLRGVSFFRVQNDLITEQLSYVKG